MNQFYRGYTILNFFNNPVLEDYDGVDVYNNVNESTLLEIKNLEIQNNFLYKGHILLFSELTLPVHDILKHSLSRFNIYVNYYSANKRSKEDMIDRSIIYCSSWVLPFIFYSLDTNKTFYEACIRHRLQVETFNRGSVLI